MKIRKPSIKKNRESESQIDGPVFDLTGGSDNSGSSASGKASHVSAAGSAVKGNVLKAAKGAIRDTAAGERKPDDTFGLMGSDEDSFEVSVRNADPLLRRVDEEKAGRTWIPDLQLNISSALIIVAIFGLLLTAADMPEMTLFALPAIPVFLALTTLESFDKERIRLYAAAALAAALIVAVIVLRKYIGNGWALIMNSLYDTGEASQAYVYDRFHVGATGDEHPYRSMHFALIWASSLIALLAALPPAESRRSVITALGCFAMIAFAYYGIIPSIVCIAVMAAALVFALARGHILSSLPVLLVVMLVFGAVMLIDPGESYGVSRADENFRDRFALRSSYLETGDQSVDDLAEIEKEMNEKEKNANNGDTGFFTEHRGITALIVALLIAAAIGAVAWMLLRRIRKKQLANRAGIDSNDPREAIKAMFPYAVRWLQPAGIVTAGKTFDSLIPLIRADISEEYAESYSGMYKLWEEAAYSDHEMTEERRQEMGTFLSDTISMIRGKGSLTTNIINKFRYAL